MLAQSFGSFGINLTLLTIVMVIIVRARKKDIRWKSAFSYGGLIAVLIALWQLNKMPETLMWVNSSMSFSTMLFQKILMDVIINSILIGLIITIIIAGAEAYYREQYPNQIALRNIFSSTVIKTKYF